MTRVENLEMGIAAAIVYAHVGQSMDKVVGKLQDALDAPCEETPMEEAMERAQKAEERLAAIIAHWRRLADAMDVTMLLPAEAQR